MKPGAPTIATPLLDTLQRGLAELDAQGLRRVRRTADTACDAHMRVDGRDIVGFASNDYLGLAAHPALVAAFAERAALRSGSGGSHLLGGHSRAHARSRTNSPASRAASPTRARCTSAPATWPTSPR
jgi:8-amino-7-oxononanoate synthase